MASGRDLYTQEQVDDQIKNRERPALHDIQNLFWATYRDENDKVDNNYCWVADGWMLSIPYLYSLCRSWNITVAGFLQIWDNSIVAVKAQLRCNKRCHMFRADKRKAEREYVEDSW